MSASKRGGGCGCCGVFLIGFFLLLLVGLGYSYFATTNALRKYASDSARPLPATQSNRQLYLPTRERFDRFFASPAERSITLTEAELNALLREAPELKLLQGGAVATLRQNSAEISCSLPVNLLFFSGHYLNYTLYFRPSLRGEEVEFVLFRMDKEGKQMSAHDLHEFQASVVRPLEMAFSGWNKLQLDRSIRDIRIENGSMVISR